MGCDFFVDSELSSLTIYTDGKWTDASVKPAAFPGKLAILQQRASVVAKTRWCRLGIKWGLCGQDSPLGIRFCELYPRSLSVLVLCADDCLCIADLNSAFPAGTNVAATWDKTLAYLRGKAMGEEFNDKGVDILLGPAAGPLGKYPDGGRIWEGFSPDPALTGVLFAETIKGIQDAGVIATAKHYILNEQEHFRQVGEAQGYGYNITETISSNVDDKTMHELYLW